MVFGHHNLKLDEIKSDIRQAKYDDAKNNIAKHIKNELRGKAILNELRESINVYDKELQEIHFLAEELTDETTPGRMARRDLCVSKVEFAKNHLIAIHDLIVAASRDFEE